MKKILLLILLTIPLTLSVKAQIEEINPRDIAQVNADGTVLTRKDLQAQADSLGTNREVPKGLKVWTVDGRFGDRMDATPDTLSHLFMNTIFTTGLYGQFNTTGNLGAPRQNRLFIDREASSQFIFTDPYDFVLIPIDQFHFTNTLSPFTNLSFNTAGDKTQGEDHFNAKFGVNVGKRLGLGFNFDYLYGRGYYYNQNTSHLNYTLYGSYIGDRYQAHMRVGFLHQKVAENGGITNDNYITHPERFNDEYESLEIPVLLSENWNRNNNQHLFFTHRYNVGFTRKVKMTDDEIKARKFALESKKENDELRRKEDAQRKAQRNGTEFNEQEYNQALQPSGRPDDARIMGAEPAVTASTPGQRIAVNDSTNVDSLMAGNIADAEEQEWMKNEYVPVTSFIHTLQIDNYKRIYQAYDTPENYYANFYDVEERLGDDNIYDLSKMVRMKNTFAIALLEGFNKWAKAGLKAFATHEYRKFTLPADIGTTSFVEHAVTVGGQMQKQQGNWLHYNVLGEVGVAGTEAGSLNIDAGADLNMPFAGDTLTLEGRAFFHRDNPTFFYRHYQSRHFWWDQEDLDNTIHTRLEGILTFRKTQTRLRVALDEIKNYTFFAFTYDTDEELNRYNHAVQSLQCDDAITVLTAQLEQNFRMGILNWENILTVQSSSKKEVLPLPSFNLYSNLYLKFKIAKVLKCDLGADVRYFSKYDAPEYAPGLGQYAVQGNTEKVKVGGYPLVNVYANFHLKHTRFFVMMSHVNEGLGTPNYFFTPHYPLNQRILRFGLSWNFFN